jgi:hypothetical protein
MNGNAHVENNIGSLFERSSGKTMKASKTESEEFVEDLEYPMPGVIPTISNQVSNHVSLVNGHVGNGSIKKHAQRQANGNVGNGRLNLKSMLEDAEMDSHI